MKTNPMIFNRGDKVHYAPEFGKKENGIVKGMHPTDKEIVFVVYNCAGNWDYFENYTAAGTNINDLKKGWVE